MCVYSYTPPDGDLVEVETCGRDLVTNCSLLICICLIKYCVVSVYICVFWILGPTAVKLIIFHGCLSAWYVDTPVECNYNVSGCSCLRKGQSGWQTRENAGANFALLVVQTNWCLPILHVPVSLHHPESFPCHPSCFIYCLRHTLNSTLPFTFLSYLIHPLYSEALIASHNFALLPSITFTLTVCVAFSWALFRFSVTMTLNL